MRKKILSVLMCLCLVATMLVGCKKSETPETPEQPTAAPTAAATETPVVTEAPVKEATAATLPTPVYYYSFDQAAGTDGIAVVQRDSATVVNVPDKDVVFVNGVKGEAIYADGATGYKLPDVNGFGESYTVSFWVNASRCATYMPTLQYGPDIHGDLTGGQHYVNFTWAEWSGAQEFPCVWTYHQAGDEAVVWPNWFPDYGQTRVKEWLNCVLVVDENVTTDEGSNLVATFYVNGEKFGEPTIVKGTMSASDNFEMLLGVNYWDTTFKGAFDELYVFDEVLTEDQVALLYKDGNQQSTYVEPEHEFNVEVDPAAIDHLGTVELDNAFWSDFSASYEIKDGETWQVKLRNWSDGAESFHNYIVAFANTAIEAHVAPNEIPGYAEYAVVRADAFGWTPAGDIDAKAFTYTWGNWKTWSQKVMRDATVTLNIKREGNNLIVEADNVDYNGSSNAMTATVVDAVTPDAPVYFFLTNEASYVDILSVKNKTPMDNAGVTVGTPDLTCGFWSSFSPIWKVSEGESRTFGFTNYTSGAANWDNFVVVLQSTPTGHNGFPNLPEDYREYGVMRADNYGWGTGYEGIAVAECDWNWDSFLSDIDGAHVAVTVTNNGATADVAITATATNGDQYHQYYTGVAIDGDLYVTFTCEQAFLQFDANVVGATDCSALFWTAFSDIWAVPAGEKRSVSFRNYTDGKNNWDNFVLILQNVAMGHNGYENLPEEYKEYAVLRADNYGWGTGYEGIAVAESNWNWDTFTSDMDGAYVDLTVVNNGTTADVFIHITTEDGNAYFQNYTGIAIDGDLYASLTLEGAYIVIDAYQIGSSDNTLPFWSQFGPLVKVAEGETESVSFTNFTAGGNNWDNFVLILQNTATGHNGLVNLPEEYKEYAVVRADNYGWGSGYEGIAVAESNWNWDTFTSDMDGASVIAEVTNNGTTADIVISVSTATNKCFIQKYTGIAIDGDLYFCVSGEAGHFVLD